MAGIVVVGAGLGGLATATLLAQGGHDVTVVERDPAPPPDPSQAWSSWERRGVNQFRMLHFIQPRHREVLEAELPSVAKALEEAGALRYDPLGAAPAELVGPRREGDDRYVALTARRPVFESVMARCAEDMGVAFHRGAGVAGLLSGDPTTDGVPHVVGVRLENGHEVRAELVVDASGRRSRLPAWLADLGARPPYEEEEDCGFVYYGRHFRSEDGSLPPMIGPLLQDYGSISVLTLPADNGTWGVGIITSSGDGELRSLRNADTWCRVIATLPLAAHWAHGEPLDDVAVMAGIEDRYRRFCVDGVPVATGVLAVGDSWACTNPSVGRGATIAMLHAVALRELLREEPLEEPYTMATAWDARTGEAVEPWYRATLAFDRHRLADMIAQREGRTYETEDPAWGLTKAFQQGAMSDADLIRAFLAVGSMLATGDEAIAMPSVFEKVIAVGDSWRDAPPLGPPRAELVAMAR